MAPRTQPITDIMIRTVKPGQRVTDGMVKGLVFERTQQGKTLWRFRYRVEDKKDTTITLGDYPTLTIPQARDQAIRFLAGIERGDTPKIVNEVEARIKEINIIRASKPLFKDCVELYLDVQRKKNQPKTVETSIIRIKKHLTGEISNLPIEDITFAYLKNHLQYIHSHFQETSKKIRQILNGIFREAVKNGFITNNPMNNLKQTDHVGEVKTGHHAAIITPVEFGELVNKIESYNIEGKGTRRGSEIIQFGLMISAYTGVRSETLRFAKWNEIDFNNNLWTIPPDHLKKRKDDKNKEHFLTIPLSSQTNKYFERLKYLSDNNDIILPSFTGNELSDGVWKGTLDSLGYAGKHTQHGFRTSFKTMCLEQLKVPEYLVRSQMDHATKDPNGRAYDRALYIEDRTKLMQLWSDYIDYLRGIKQEYKTWTQV
jgi:integrase